MEPATEVIAAFLWLLMGIQTAAPRSRTARIQYGVGRGYGTNQRGVPNPLRVALGEHGLAAPTVDALVGRHVPALIGATRRAKVEHAVMLDADSGDQLGGLLVGTRFEIELGQHLSAMRPDREYVSVHSHPSDGSFSRRDGALLYRYPRVRANVVGRRGTVYLLSRLADSLPSPDLMVAAFRIAHEQHTPAYERVIAERSMGERAANRLRSHAVWETIAAECGLRYTRLER